MVYVNCWSLIMFRPSPHLGVPLKRVIRGHTGSRQNWGWPRFFIFCLYRWYKLVVEVCVCSDQPPPGNGPKVGFLPFVWKKERDLGNIMCKHILYFISSTLCEDLCWAKDKTELLEGRNQMLLLLWNRGCNKYSQPYLGITYSNVYNTLYMYWTMKMVD